jgi:hypothetical protein
VRLLCLERTPDADAFLRLRILCISDIHARSLAAGFRFATAAWFFTLAAPRFKTPG